MESAPGPWGARAARALVVLGLAVVLPLLTTSPAAAHARLLETEPGLGAVLGRQPEEVELVFTEPVRPPLTVLVTDGAGRPVSLDSAYVNGTTVEQSVRLDAAPGRWTVVYRVVGADGHPVPGTASFTVGTGTGQRDAAGGGPSRPLLAAAVGLLALAGGVGVLRRRRVLGTLAVGAGALVLALAAGGGAPQPVPAGLPDAGPLVGWARPVLRLAVEAALVVAYGLLLGAAVLVRTPRRAARAPAADVSCAAGAAGVGALASLALLWVTASDITGAPAGEQVLTRFVTVDPQGRALAAQVVLATVVAVIGLAVTDGRAGVDRRVAGRLAAGAAAALVPPLLVGHLVLGGGGPGLAEAVLLLHVLAAATWLGGLVALVRAAAVVGAPGLRASLPAFSTLALGCAVAVGLTGAANVVLRVGDRDDLGSGYGLLLLLKVAGFAALLVAGAAQRRSVARLLADAPAGGPGAVRSGVVRLAVAEIALMAATFGVAAALTRTPSPPRELPALADGASVLGQAPPVEASPLRLATGHLLDGPALLVVLAVAVAVAARVVAVRVAGPAAVRRTAAWGVAGVVVLAWATLGGLGLYARVGLPANVAAHGLVAVVAPVLLLRAGVGTRWPVRVPLLVRVPAPVALAVLVAGSTAVYLPDVFDRAMRTSSGHWLLTAAGLVGGFVGLARCVPPAVPDAVPPAPGDAVRLLPVGERSVVLVGGVAAAAVLTTWLVGAERIVGQAWFTSFEVPYLRSLGDDQRRAGFLLWFTVGVPLLAVLGVPLLQRDRRSVTSADAASTDAVPASTSNV